MPDTSPKIIDNPKNPESGHRESAGKPVTKPKKKEIDETKQDLNPKNDDLSKAGKPVTKIKKKEINETKQDFNSQNDDLSKAEKPVTKPKKKEINDTKEDLNPQNAELSKAENPVTKAKKKEINVTKEDFNPHNDDLSKIEKPVTKPKKKEINDAKEDLNPQNAELSKAEKPVTKPKKKEINDTKEDLNPQNAELSKAEKPVIKPKKKEINDTKEDLNPTNAELSKAEKPVIKPKKKEINDTKEDLNPQNAELSKAEKPVTKGKKKEINETKEDLNPQNADLSKAGKPVTTAKKKEINVETNDLNPQNADLSTKRKKVSEDETKVSKEPNTPFQKLKSILKGKKRDSAQQPEHKSPGKVVINSNEVKDLKNTEDNTKFGKQKRKKNSRVVPLKQTENTTHLDTEEKTDNVDEKRKRKLEVKEKNEKETFFGKRKSENDVRGLELPEIKKRKVNIIVEDDSKHPKFKENSENEETKTKKKKNAKSNKNEDGKIPKEKSPKNTKLHSKKVKVKVGNRRLSIGVKDANQVDPLEAQNIREASSYKEWSLLANQSLPSKAGIEVSPSSMNLLTLMPPFDATKRFSLNSKETLNSLRQELVRRGTLMPMMLRSQPQDPSELRKETSEARRKSVVELQEFALEEAVRDDLDPHVKIINLRSVADHLSNKRLYKAEILAFAKLKGSRHNITFKEKIKHCFGWYLMLPKRFFRTLRNWSAVFVIWKNHLRHIEGHYGVDTHLYFSRIRMSILVNICCVLIALGVVVIPELYTMGIMKTYEEISHIRVRDIFTGEGHLMNEKLKFYYNSYSATPGKKYFQSNPFRFCIALILVFAINTFVIGVKVSKFYHSSRLQSNIPGFSVAHSLEQLICAWDFSISTEAFAELRRQNIARDLRAQLPNASEAKKHSIDEENKDIFSEHRKKIFKWIFEKFGRNAFHWVLFTVINLFTVICAGANGTIIYYLSQWRFGQFITEFLSVKQLKTNQRISNLELAQNVDLPVIFVLLPTLWKLVSGQLFIIICKYFAQHEMWRSNRSRLFALLSRVGFFWFIENLVFYICRSHNAPLLIDNDLCWETFFGSEFYRLIYLQEVVCWLFTMVYDRYQMHKKYKDPTYVLRAFDSERFTLNLIYSTTLASIAFVLCPLSRLVLIIRQILSFYHGKFVLINCTSIPSTIASASHMVPYLVATCICYMISSSLNFIFLLHFQPSKHCGPFDGDSYFHSAAFASDKVWLQITNVFGSPGVSYTFIFLCIGAFYTMKFWANAYHLKMIKLHELLILEKQDREFLMKAIYNLGKVESSSATRLPNPKVRFEESQPPERQTSFHAVPKWKQMIRQATLLKIATSSLQNDSSVEVKNDEVKNQSLEAKKNVIKNYNAETKRDVVSHYSSVLNDNQPHHRHHRSNQLQRSKNFLSLSTSTDHRRLTTAEKLYLSTRRSSDLDDDTFTHQVENENPSNRQTAFPAVGYQNGGHKNPNLHHTMSLMVINEIKRDETEKP